MPIVRPPTPFMHRRSEIIAVLAVLLAVLSTATPAYALGYWNLPGNAAQWWGYGWGGGHHACFVLGPVSHHGAFSHRHVRLPHAPQPAYGWSGECTQRFDFRQPSPQFAVPACEPFQPSSSVLSDGLSPPETMPVPGTIQPAPVEP